MNVFLLTDLEGIPGVLSIDAIASGTAAYADACVRLTQSINDCARICRAAGADQVYFLDGHGGGGNVRADLLDGSAVQTNIAGWEALLRDGAIDCQIELGAHARAGTINGFLDHTISSRQWFALRVNGTEYSELAMHAALCGQYGVPVVCCIGDETACRQAQEYIPSIRTAAVKRAEGRNRAVPLPDCDAAVRAAITDALASVRQIPPMQLALPAEVQLTFYRTDMCEAVLETCGAETTRVDARTLRKTLTELTSYADLKFGSARGAQKK